MYARHQAALAELTQSVLANTARSTLMRQAVTMVADTLAVAYSAIWELGSDRSALVFRTGSGWPPASVANVTLPVMADCSIGSSVLGTTPVIIADWPSETKFNQPPALRGHGVISSFAVVIPGPDHPFGCLSADVTASRRFSDEEVHFLQAVANVLALAFERRQANLTIEQQVADRARAIDQQLVATAQDAAVLEERQRLARDLHDSVTQALYGVTLQAQAARRFLVVGEVASAAESLRVLQDTAQEALDEMRLLIFELRPPILEQVGLVAALQARLNAVEGRASLQTRLIGDLVGDLPPVVERALYRIAQEALNNVLKHARARCVTVSLLVERSTVILEIADDGVGFDLAVANERGGVGLRGIAERVARLDGKFTLRSAPGAGAQLCVEITL